MKRNFHIWPIKLPDGQWSPIEVLGVDRVVFSNAPNSEGVTRFDSTGDIEPGQRVLIIHLPNVAVIMQEDTDG